MLFLLKWPSAIGQLLPVSELLGGAGGGEDMTLLSTLSWCASFQDSVKAIRQGPCDCNLSHNYKKKFCFEMDEVHKENIVTYDIVMC